MNGRGKPGHRTVPRGTLRRLAGWLVATGSRTRGAIGAGIAGTERVEELDYAGAEVLIRVRSQRERTRLGATAKERWTVDWIESWVNPDDVLYDIGANIGAYSLIAAKRPGGPARVVAVEPGYASFAALCENIILNGLDKQIEPLPICLSDRTGTRKFAYRDLEPGAGTHGLNGAGSREDEFDPVYRQTVLTFSLDDLLERFSLPFPNHIKLDVDGSELAVLEGAANTLAEPSLRSLMIEIDDEKAERLVRHLAQRGFDLRERFRHRAAGRLATHSYGLFARESG